MKVHKGDTVIVLSGQYRGQTGQVKAVFPRLRRVLVDGVNVKTRHVKPTGSKKPGGIEKTPRPIDVSKVALLRPGSKTLGSRVAYEMTAKGSKRRVYRQAGNKEVK